MTRMLQGNRPTGTCRMIAVRPHLHRQRCCNHAHARTRKRTRTHARTHARTNARAHARTHARARPRTHARATAGAHACKHALTRARTHRKKNKLIYEIAFNLWVCSKFRVVRRDPGEIGERSGGDRGEIGERSGRDRRALCNTSAKVGRDREEIGWRCATCWQSAANLGQRSGRDRREIGDRAATDSAALAQPTAKCGTVPNQNMCAFALLMIEPAPPRISCISGRSQHVLSSAAFEPRFRALPCPFSFEALSACPCHTRV